MAFTLKAKSESFYYPINLAVVSESGSSVTQRFEFKFKRLSRTKINELQKQQEEISKMDVEVDSLERDSDYLMEVADGWKGVQDENGVELPFTRDNVKLLLDSVPNASGEIVKAFFESTFGGGAKRKN